MIKLGCCIEMMFCEVPFVERVGLASKAGFSAAEFWSWQDKNLHEIEDALQQAGIPGAACIVGTADAARAERYGQGAMLVKANSGLYAEMVEETIDAVSALGIRTLIATTGQALPGVDRARQQDAIVGCLMAAAPVLEKHGFTIALEALNTLVDHKGYYLDSTRQALEITRQVNSPTVKLLFDVYHMQVMEGNLIATIRENAGMIGHIHIADVPGRHEPGSGEINYGNVFKAISSSGYMGYVGCEYGPSEGLSTPDSAKEALRQASLCSGK